MTAVLAVAAATLPALLLLPAQRRLAVIRLFALAVLNTLGVAQQVRGRLPRGGALVVANHISWLDALVLLARLPVRPVAKCEVRDWPFVGALAAAAGTLFLERSRPRALPSAIERVAAALRAGDTVAVFPEGTTWCGRSVGRFRPAMFQAAIDAGAPIVPASLRYLLPDGQPTTMPAFIGDEPLWSSLRRVLSAPGLRVEVHIHPALHPDSGASRRALATAAAAAVGSPGRDIGASVHPVRCAA
jgi:1-acyl-sn-glycerol-3-phosphate acyltransferase